MGAALGIMVQAQAGGVGLAVVPPPPILNETLYPITWSSAETTTINLARVTAVLDTAHPMPSADAGMPFGKKTDAMKRIDDLYRTYTRRYRDEMNLARAKDLLAIPELNTKLATRLDNTNYERYYGLWGMVFFLIGGLGGYLIGRGSNQRRDERNALVKAEILRDQSAYRRACIMKISGLEEDRLEKTKDILEERLKTIDASLLELSTGGETDVALEEEFIALVKIYKKNFPENELTFRPGVNLDTRVTQIKERTS